MMPARRSRMEKCKEETNPMGTAMGLELMVGVVEQAEQVKRAGARVGNGLGAIAEEAVELAVGGPVLG